MTTNDVGTCSWLVEELAAARIIAPAKLAPYLAQFVANSPYADADAFARHLVSEQVLSQYQAKRAVDGDAKKLVFGAYILFDVVGSGSIGPVYKVHGRADYKPYAMKVLPQRAWNMHSARHQVRLFEELRIREGLVPFIDVGIAHGQHYFVWPFIEGKTLENVVRTCGPLPSNDVANIGHQLIQSLERCHNQGLIHGMIKPSNVMITERGQALLLDFGIGALLADNADDDMLVDTVSRAESIARMLECSAPESIINSSKWIASGDQYSLGCTLYFALTGRFPFPGGTFIDKIVNHQMNKPATIASLNADAPRNLVTAIERMMNKLPHERFLCLDDLKQVLEPLTTGRRLSESVPVNVQTPPPLSPLGRPSDHSIHLNKSAFPSESLVPEVSGETEKRSIWRRIFG